MNVVIALVICIIVTLVLLVMGFITCRNGRDSNLFFVGMWAGVFGASAVVMATVAFK